MLPICGVVCFLLSIYGIENFANEDLFVLTCSSIIMLFLVVGIVFVLVQKGRLRKKYIYALMMQLSYMLKQLL